MNLAAVETCLVTAGRHLGSIVGNRDNKYHPGSTELNVLSNVGKVNVSDLTKVAVGVKVDMLDESVVKDTARSNTGTARDSHDTEPISWHCFGIELMGELLHRFRPKLVVLYTASDPLEILPMMEAKTPVIAYCILAASVISLDVLDFKINKFK